MTPEQWTEIQRHLDRLVDLRPEERAEYLDSITDVWIRGETERILGEMEEEGSFLDRPAFPADWVPQHAFDHSLHPEEVLLNRFQIQKVIGYGGMGEVYAARDQRLGETVAIKTILPELRHDSQYVNLLRTEVKRARQITHQNVCRIYDLFEDTDKRGLVFFTMELVPGESLAQRLKTTGPCPPALALEIAAQIGDGLDAAHAAGLLHRDLKPANILLGTDGRAVITDFGLARSISINGRTGSTGIGTGPPDGRSPRLPSPSKPGSDTRAFHSGPGSLNDGAGRGPCGTLRYLAPEQLNGEPASKATDIYAFGLTLYELVTASFPFDGAVDIVAAARRLTTEPLKPSQRVPGLPRRWDRAILWCLQRDPAHRAPSARAVVELLRDGGRRWDVVPLVTRISRRQWLGLGIGATAAGALYSLYRRGGAPPDTDFKSLVLIADASGPQEHPHLAVGLRQALLTGFESTGNVDAFPSWRLQSTLARLGEASNARVEGKLAAEIARQESIRYVAFPQVRFSNQGIVLSVHVVRAASWQTAADVAETSGTEAELAATADRLVRACRRLLGELESSVAATPSLDRVTTNSFLALARFSEGLRYYEEGRGDQALALLRSAAEMDPDFAMAHEYQALAYSAAGEERLGFPSAQRAHALRMRTTEHERRQIDAMYQIYRGDYDKALDAYLSLVSLFPQDARALRQLAHHYSIAGRTKEAVGRAKEAAGIDSRPLAHVVYALVLAQDGNAAAARDVAQKAVQHGVDARLLGWANGLVAMVEGDAARAEEFFGQFAAVPGHLSNGLLLRCGAMILAGNLRGAQEQLEAALPAVLIRQESLLEVHYRHLSGLLSRRIGKAAEAAEHAEALAGRAAEPWNLDPLRYGAHIAFELRSRKLLAECVERLRKINRQFPGTRSEGFRREAESLYAVLAGAHEDGKQLARQAASLWPDCWSRWVLGTALVAAGEYQEAMDPLQTLIRKAGDAFRWNGALPWVEAHVLVARCLAKTGKSDLAGQYYDRYLQLWRDALPFSPDTRLAGTERAALGKKQ